jgi:hypothetical protein
MPANNSKGAKGLTIIMNNKDIIHHLEVIIGHLLTAQIQRISSDDKIISEHIDVALITARVLRRIILNLDKEEAA